MNTSFKALYGRTEPFRLIKPLSGQSAATAAAAVVIVAASASAVVIVSAAAAVREEENEKKNYKNDAPAVASAKV